MAGHPGEKITEGLDGLRARLKEYSQMGARFAKWRAVIPVGDGVPSRSGLEANAHALARYAMLCQEAGLVRKLAARLALLFDRCASATGPELDASFTSLSAATSVWTHSVPAVLRLCSGLSLQARNLFTTRTSLSARISPPHCISRRAALAPPIGPANVQPFQLAAASALRIERHRRTLNASSNHSW
jgi:hypothetical protein